MVLPALVSRRAFVVAKRGAGPVSKREPQAPPPPVAKHRAVEGTAAVVRLGAFGVVAGAKREVGARAAGESWQLSTPPRAEWLALPQRPCTECE